jgi:hypothetical protein
MRLPLSIRPRRHMGAAPLPVPPEVLRTIGDRAAHKPTAAVQVARTAAPRAQLIGDRVRRPPTGVVRRIRTGVVLRMPTEAEHRARTEATQQAETVVGPPLATGAEPLPETVVEPLPEIAAEQTPVTEAARARTRPPEAETFLYVAEDRRTFARMDPFARSIATVCRLIAACMADARWSACTTERAW